MSHDAEGITLLCPTHHRAKGGFISNATLATHLKNPFCKSSGFSHTVMDIGDLTIEIGPYVARQSRVALQVKDWFSVRTVSYGVNNHSWIPSISTSCSINAIWFEEPEAPDGPLRLNATIYRADGLRLAWIENNIWHGSSENFDIKVVSGLKGGRVVVKGFNGQTILELELRPPRLVRITKLISYYGGRLVEIRGTAEDGLIMRDGNVLIAGSRIYLGACHVALSL